MRVVIVGGAGFIGTELARTLAERGDEPIVFDSQARLARTAGLLVGVRVVEFDFPDGKDICGMLKGADVVVHLACTTNPAASMKDLAWDAQSNIVSSIRLFDAARNAGVGKVVFASSGGTIYGVPDSLPVSEADPTRPLSAYGVSKLAIEKYLSLYQDLAGVSLRIANPYGAYQLTGTAVGVIARYMSAVRSGQPIEVWGDGSVVRDYVAIADVVEAFVRTIDSSELDPGSYNIGSGEGRSVNDIIAEVFAVTGREVPVTYVRGRPYDVPAIVLDCSLFRRETGWSARTSLREGVGALWSMCPGIVSGGVARATDN